MSSEYFIYGTHAVKAALENPKRNCLELLITKDLEKEFSSLIHQNKSLKGHITSRKELSQLLGENTVHQGCALKVQALNPTYLENIIAENRENSLIVVLDQITDPHNIGAILRSCAAYGAHAVIVQDKNSPSEDNGILTKNACGATEHTPIISVTNLSRAIDELKSNDYWCAGLDERGKQFINEINLSGKNILVMGAEGAGMRRLTREKCDYLVKLPTSEGFPTLNVSNAAACALYQFAISQK